MARLLRSTRQSKLRPPAVVAAPVVFRPIKVVLGDPPRPSQYSERRQTHSKLRPPTVVGTAAVFVARPVKVVLNEARPAQFLDRRQPHYVIRKPVVVDPAVVYSPVRVKTVTQPRRYQKTAYKVRPPIVVDSPVVFAPVKVRLSDLTKPAQYDTRRRPHSLLRPARIGSVQTFTVDIAGTSTVTVGIVVTGSTAGISDRDYWTVVNNYHGN